MTQISAITLLILLSSNAFGAASNSTNVRYSLKDLEVLQTEKDFDDFFDHAKDVLPSLRNEKWKSMVDEMAVLWIKELRQKGSLDQKNYQMMEEILELSPLKTNEHYLVYRGELGLKYFKEKYPESTDKESMLNSMKEFWRKDQNHHELGLSLMKLVFEETGNISDAWYFAETPMKSQQAAFYCKRSDILPLVMQKIRSALEESAHSPKKIILSLIHPDAWALVKNEFKSSYFNYPQRIRGQLYTLMLEENMLTDQEKDLYSFFYIMEGPVKGEAMNLSWNLVEKLKSDSSKRELLLEKLSELNSLPDAILGSYDLKRRKVIVSFIAKSFPEYFDFYARTCVQYLKGEVKFENGNPTAHCRDLFKMVEKDSDLVNSTLTIQFKQAIKL